MAESIQTYYEKLISLQSESIQKNLIKYGLTNWEKVARTLTNKERDFIIKRYKVGSNLSASSFFRKIIVRAQLDEADQNRAIDNINKKPTKKVNYEAASKRHKDKTIDYRSIQDYYMYLVSKQPLSIRSFLKMNDLLEFDNALVWFDDSDWEFLMNGYSNGVGLRVNELGRVFSKLCSNYVSHQDKSKSEPQLQNKNSPKEKPFKAVRSNKNNLVCQEVHRPSLLLQQCVLEVSEQPVKQEEKSPRKPQIEDSTVLRLKQEDLFFQWIDRLPLWYIEALIKNGCTSFNKFVEEIRKPTFSYKGIRHFEQKMVNELRMMASVLSWLYSQLEHNTETTRFLLSKLSDYDLSIRAVNCLESINVITIKDLLPLNFDALGSIRNCGKKTAIEIVDFIALIKGKYGISEDPMTTEVAEQPSCSEKNGERLNDYTIILRYKLSFANLSVRAVNCLKSLNVVTIADLLPLNYHTLMTVQNCGKKTALEIVDFIASVKEKYGFSETALIPQTQKPVDDPIVRFVSNEDIEAVACFKEKNGHWPMMFILIRLISQTLTAREQAVFEDYYGICAHPELNAMTQYRIKQINVKVYRRLVSNSALKRLCRYKDWNLYCVNNIPISMPGNEEVEKAWQEIEETISLEKSFLENHFRETVSSEDDYKKLLELLSRINLSTYKVLLLFWGMKPYWIDLNKKDIVSYCPSDNKECNVSNSIIVINKRFAAFKFGKATKEICRLQKERIVDDIVLSVEKYFIDNVDYWTKTVRLSNEDRVSLMSVLKELFKGVCHANIINDKIILKANTVDYSDKLYDILVNAGTRLHRDELYKRLKDLCDEKEIGFSLTDSSQITVFLSRDPRIITYGKSSFWGLKMWGESYGSIHDLALRFVNESKEPIQIEELTRLILENRPDSNSKSISAIIRQTVSNGELLLFYGDYIGHPQAEYSNEYRLMPRDFDEWLQSFKKYVLENKRYPVACNEFEGYLYRWYKRAIRLTDLSAEEILKIDALEKELADYPRNYREYNYLHKCDLYKKFVEGNNRMLEESDDKKLYHWFFFSKLYYNTYNDNRGKYFRQLLQYLSNKLY